MSRDSGGNYTLPNAAFVSGTTISSSVMNSNFSDLSSEITNSLDRNGKGGMLARWRGVDGTSASPAYSFTNETTLGFWRAGSDDLRAASNATDIMRWKGTGVTVYQAFTAEKGLTITNSTTNGAGATVTGNGTGAGLAVTGGSSSGTGLTVTAGAGNGTGASIAGTGTGNGLSVTGAIGAVATGTANEGLAAVGAAGKAGLKSRAGTAATASAAQTALYVEDGYLGFRQSDLSAAVNPNKDVAFTNTLTPVNTCKALSFFRVTTGGGVGNFSVTVNDGFNVTSVARLNATTIRVTYASAFASSTYVRRPEIEGVVTTKAVVSAATTTTTDISIVTVSTGATIDLDATSALFDVTLLVYGRQ